MSSVDQRNLVMVVRRIPSPKQDLKFESYKPPLEHVLVMIQLVYEYYIAYTNNNNNNIACARTFTQKGAVLITCVNLLENWSVIL